VAWWSLSQLIQRGARCATRGDHLSGLISADHLDALLRQFVRVLAVPPLIELLAWRN
jgi:hypothetical protein